MHTWRTSISPSQTLVESFSAKWEQDHLQWEPVRDSAIANINSQETLELPTVTDVKQQKGLNEALYNSEHLRKRLHAADDE